MGRKPDADSICNVCNKSVTEAPTKRPLQCNVCSKWLHGTCDFVSAEDFTHLTSCDRAIFCCSKCNWSTLITRANDFSAAYTKINELLVDNESLKKQNQELSIKFNTLQQDLISLKESFQQNSEMKRSIKEVVEEVLKAGDFIPNADNINADNDQKYSKRIEFLETALEHATRDKIKNNIVFFNVPYSNGEINFKNQIGDKLNIKPIRAYRVGKTYDDRIRPLKIELDSIQTKISILKKFHSFKRESAELIGKIWCRSDMTFIERKHEENLRNDLKAKRSEDPTKKWVIYRGKIVPSSKN